MTVFHLALNGGWKPALAVVAAHGMTDFHALGAALPHYAAWVLAPMPSPMVTGVFCAASFTHFAEDGGPWATAFAHAGALIVGLLRGTDTALKFMVAYLLVWHTPHHYRRHWHRKRIRGLVIALLATVASLFTCHRLPDRIALSNLLQRIIIAHISLEICIEDDKVANFLK